MARGQASGDEISSGLRSVGTLSSLAKVPGPRRDSPFAGVSPERAPLPQPKPQPATVERPQPAVAAPAVRSTPRAEPHPRPKPHREARRPRAGEYTDEVTVPMTAEMRTRAGLLAADLQRRRSDRSERLTANSVFRVAIQTFLDRFTARDFANVSTEEELRVMVARAMNPATDPPR